MAEIKREITNNPHEMYSKENLNWVAGTVVHLATAKLERLQREPSNLDIVDFIISHRDQLMRESSVVRSKQMTIVRESLGLEYSKNPAQEAPRRRKARKLITNYYRQNYPDSLSLFGTLLFGFRDNKIRRLAKGDLPI